MAHIRQKNSSLEEDKAYTVVLDPDKLMENHPAMLQHPERFEIVDIDIPDDAQFLNYSG